MTTTDLGYARVSTTHQDLTRQLDALNKHGIADDRLYVDKKSGATVDRDGLKSLLAYARSGDTIVCYTLDRLGRNLRECLNLIHELREKGVGVKTLADPIPIDTTDDSPMAQVAVALLALFAEMERVWNRERAAHARAVAEANGKQTGRPRALTADRVALARRMKASGESIPTICDALQVSRATLYRALSDGDASA